jgi:predicted dehydrogenase
MDTGTGTKRSFGSASDRRLRVAVVGVGYFGCHHCEKIQALEEVVLTAVVDIDPACGQRAAKRFGVPALVDHRRLAGLADAAVVAVPSQAHRAVTADLLRAGLDVLVEKPLATSLAGAEELCKLASERAACIQVGHLERFNPILAEALARVRGPRFVRMDRLGPFPGRGSDVSVVYELMIHDLDILLQITQAELRSVSASGWSLVTDHLDVAVASLEFEDGLQAELTASRVSSRQVRAFSVLDQAGLLEVDLAGRRLRRNSFVAGRQQIERLELEPGDALLAQDQSFVRMLTDGRRPVVCGLAGRAAVGLAERIEASVIRT